MGECRPQCPANTRWRGGKWDGPVDADHRIGVLDDQLFVVFAYVVLLSLLFTAWVDSVERRVRKLEAVSEAGGEVE